MANQTISTSQDIETVIASGLSPGDNITVNGGAVLTCTQTPSMILGRMVVNDGILHIDGTSISAGNNINFVGTGGDTAVDETITVGGQGKFLVTGAWYDLGTTNGTDSQVFDVGTYWDNLYISSIPMIQIETGRRINYTTGTGLDPVAGDMVTLISDRTVMGKVHSVGVGYVVVDLLTVPFVGNELIQIRKVVDNFGPDLQQTWTATVNGADIKEAGVYREFGNSRSNDINYMTGFGKGYGGLVFDNQHATTTLTLGGATGGFKPPSGCNVRVPNVNLNTSRIAEFAAGGAYRDTTSNSVVILFRLLCAGGSIELSTFNAGNALLAGTGAYEYTAEYVGSVFGIGSDSAGNRTKYDHCINVQDPVANAEPTIKFLGSIKRLHNGADVTNCMQINSQVLAAAIGATSSLDVNISDCIVSSAGQGLALDTYEVNNYYLSTVDNVTIINCMSFGNDHAETDNAIKLNSTTNLKISNFIVSSTQDYSFQSQEKGLVMCYNGNYSSIIGVEIIGNGVCGSSLVIMYDTSNFKIRAIGMVDDKIDFGTDGGVLLSLSGLCSNIDIARCYKDNGTDAEFISIPSTCKGVTLANCSGKYASAVKPSGGDTTRFKGIHGGAGTPGSATGWSGTYSASYGNNFHDGFQSDTNGTIACLMINPSIEANETTVIAGNPKFFKDGDLDLTDGDVLQLEQSYFTKGHTGFTGNFTACSGGSGYFADEWITVWGGTVIIEFQWMLLGGEWNGIWLDMRTPSNLTSIVGDISAGIKFKLQLTGTNKNTADMSMLLIDTTTTLQAQKDNMYPIDQFEATLTISNLKIGSDVVILQAGTDTVLASVDQNGTSNYSYTYSTVQNIDIGVIKQGFVTLYQYGYSLSTTDANLPVNQLIDRSYQ